MMNKEAQLWSVKRIAEFLDFSVSYTRRVIVKQSGFPAPRFMAVVIKGRPQKSKPRWISEEVIEWASQEYLLQAEFEEQQPARKGRPRKSLDELRL